jgi:hypothetical protein
VLAFDVEEFPRQLEVQFVALADLPEHPHLFCPNDKVVIDAPAGVRNADSCLVDGRQAIFELMLFEDPQPANLHQFGERDQLDSAHLRN